MHHAFDMRWRICAALCGLAVLIGTVLIGTASSAGAQTEPTDGASDALDEADDGVTEGGVTEGGDTPDARADDGAIDDAAESTEAPATPAAATDTAATDTAATDTAAMDTAAADTAAGLDAPATADDAADDDPATGDGEPQSEDAPAPRGPALSFANSFFSWTHGLTFNSLAPGAQLTHNPTYYQSFSLTPRFYLTNTTFLWLNQSFAFELTDSDDTSYNHEPLLTDTLLDLRQNLAWEGFVFQGQVRLGFPLSKASQSAGRVLQTGLGLTITRPFPELASFTVSVNGGYRRWWATRSTPGIMGEGPEYTGPGGCAAESGVASVCSQASGLTSARDIVLTGLTLTVMPLPGFTVSFQGIYLGTYGAEIATLGVPINGGTETVSDDSPTHWRHFTYFTLAVAYDVLPWMNLSLGIQNSGFVAPLYNPDGSVRSPFNPDTQIYLSMTLGLDGIYNEIFGAEESGLTPEERQRRRQGLASRGSSTSF